MGRVDADNAVVFLFDYTCAGCRHLHRLLAEAQTHFGTLAVLHVPVPLSPQCYPGIKIRHASHPQACAYARLGLAVWAADPAGYTDYARYVFDGDEPPPIGLAAREAERLTGVHVTATAPDADLDEKIQRAISTHRSLGDHKIPLLLLPNGMLEGHVPSLKELLDVLQAQFR